MNHHIIHPTKEQVRAYMAERELARRPPPAPDEIRRKLGWRLAPSSEAEVWYQWYSLPSSFGQAAVQLAQLALDHLHAASRLPYRRRD